MNNTLCYEELLEENLRLKCQLEAIKNTELPPPYELELETSKSTCINYCGLQNIPLIMSGDTKYYDETKIERKIKKKQRQLERKQAVVVVSQAITTDVKISPNIQHLLKRFVKAIQLRMSIILRARAWLRRARVSYAERQAKSKRNNQKKKVHRQQNKVINGLLILRETLGVLRNIATMIFEEWIDILKLDKTSSGRVSFEQYMRRLIRLTEPCDDNEMNIDICRSFISWFVDFPFIEKLQIWGRTQPLIRPFAGALSVFRLITSVCRQFLIFLDFVDDQMFHKVLMPLKYDYVETLLSDLEKFIHTLDDDPLNITVLSVLLTMSLDEQKNIVEQWFKNRSTSLIIGFCRFQLAKIESDIAMKNTQDIHSESAVATHLI